jgi:tRNA pseudouridine38-40 synthase
MPRNLKFTLAYDGTAYVGWQRQSEGASIQGLLEAALARIDGAPVTVHGAGRTDAGVHALGQVASAVVVTSLDAPTLRRALNATLPADVRVVALEEAPDTFHARFSAMGKAYDYWIFDGEVLPPFARAWSWHGPRRLDVQAMRAAAGVLEGTHDFSTFQSAGSDVTSAVRTVRCANVRVEPATASPLTGTDVGVSRAVGPRCSASAGVALGTDVGQSMNAADADRFVVCRLEADGFLRHMVRAIVGTLVEVGEWRRAADSVAALLAQRDRARAGPTAPARGLVLVRVLYAPVAGLPPVDLT